MLLTFLSIITLVIITAKKTQPDGQNSKTGLAGVGDGTGVTLGGDVNEAVGKGLLVLIIVLAPASITGSVPVTETKRSLTRAWADVVSSPKKMKFGVS